MVSVSRLSTTLAAPMLVPVRLFASARLSLSAELPSRKFELFYIITIKKASAREAVLMVPVSRLELPTHALRMRCSTNWAILAYIIVFYVTNLLYTIFIIFSIGYIKYSIHQKYLVIFSILSFIYLHKLLLTVTKPNLLPNLLLQ